ncbi:MAG: hypothetical protein D6732_09880 [Methanobacteriota archaeon]|nr:MAG: hypothetical protein D6732_09880 [Euryarchaeota archaeon]
MRIPDGLLIQYLTLLGWLFAIPWLVFLGRQNRNISNKTYPKLAVFTSLQFLLQIMQIPLFGFPVALGVSAVPLTILSLGFRLGLFSTSAALLLAAMLIPGYFGSFGINLLNVVFSSTIVLLPVRIRIKKKKSSRLRSLFVFFLSLFYYWTVGIMIAVELTFSHVFRNYVVAISFLAVVSIFGIAEGILSAFLFRVLASQDTSEYSLLVSPRTLPRALKDRYLKKLDLDPIGRYNRLDPRSKLITTGIFLIALALSFEFYQELIIFLSAVFLFFIYRPSTRFFNRIAIAIPFTILLTGILLLGFQGQDVEQAYKLGFRYFISFVHSSLLLESEESYFRYIEAMRELGIPKPIVTVLLISLRMANRLWEDFSSMKIAMVNRGAVLTLRLRGGWRSVLPIYMQLFNNLLQKSLKYSEMISESLEERGFTGNLFFSVQPISSEGLTLQGLAFTISLVTILSRFWI